MFSEETFSSYTQEQIDELNSQKNAQYCLVVVFGFVYNLYYFASFHPGGARLITLAAGDILDDVVTDSNHRFTKEQVQRHLAKYKFGFFEKNAVVTSASMTTREYICGKNSVNYTMT